MSAPILALLIAIFVIVSFWLAIHNKTSNTQPERVEFDDDGITRHHPDGSTESIHWNEIDTITIITTDQGPGAEDAFWVFENADNTKGCMVGNGAKGFPDLYQRLQSLPGFRDEVVIEAMGTSSNKRFVAWQRNAPG